MLTDGCGGPHRDPPLHLPPTAITEYAVVLTADIILALSTCRRQTSTGWNIAYISANRYTLPADEEQPADDKTTRSRPKRAARVSRKIVAGQQ